MTRWNNLSGTYKCNDTMAFQAGLPLDKFYAVQVGPLPDVQGSDEPHEIIRLSATHSGLWLKKLLPFCEEDLIATHNLWAGHVQAFLEGNPDASKCQHKMMYMAGQVCNAIGQYGLFSSIGKSFAPL